MLNIECDVVFMLFFHMEVFFHRTICCFQLVIQKGFNSAGESMETRTGNCKLVFSAFWFTSGISGPSCIIYLHLVRYFLPVC